MNDMLLIFAKVIIFCSVFAHILLSVFKSLTLEIYYWKARKVRLSEARDSTISTSQIGSYAFFLDTNLAFLYIRVVKNLSPGGQLVKLVFLLVKKIFWAECLHIVRYAGGVRYSFDNTRPFLFLAKGGRHGKSSKTT
jgi:hypothetical protein